MNIYYQLIQIWKLFNNEFRKKFLILQLLLIISALLEVFSLLGIAPFVSVVMGVIELEDIPILGIYIVNNFPENGVYVLGAIVGGVIIASNLFFAYVLYKKAVFSYSFGAQISNSIVSMFLSSKRNINKLNKDSLLSYSTFETDRLSKSVINELLQINARLAVSLAIISFLLYQYGIVFLIVVAFFLIIYALISLFVRDKLLNSGKELTVNNKKKLKNINDIYDIFHEIKSYRSELFFLNKQRSSNNNIALNFARIEVLSVLPRYLVEGIVFIALILVMSNLHASGQDISLLIPTTTTLVYGVLKLLPQISNIYQASSNLLANINVVDEIVNHKSNMFNEDDKLINLKNGEMQGNSIEINNLSFSYENNQVFDLFNCTFMPNNIYLIKGASGCGKSTLLSLLFGSLYTEGAIKFSQGSDKIVYIPQKNALISGSIIDNITFDNKRSTHIEDKVKNILNDLNLNMGLDEQDTDLKLSGGQVQRVSVGRLLYHNYNVVLLDEPTSALDPENERNVFEILNAIKKDKTIIVVSHSITASQYVDKIIEL